MSSINFKISVNLMIVKLMYKIVIRNITHECTPYGEIFSSNF